MFAELPKLLDRNFAVGFFLPMIIFICFGVGFLQIVGIGQDLLSNLGLDLLIETTIIGLVSWSGGILLLGANRDILRFLEGYGSYNPLRIFIKFQLRSYQNLEKQISDLETRYSDQGNLSEEDTDLLNQCYRNRIRRFPDQEKFVLPTPFGNAIRAFEVYPRLMYGIESIVFWPRLWAVIPQDFRNFIESSKTHMDFWVNLGVLNFLFGVEVFAVGISEIFEKMGARLVFTGGAFLLCLLVGALCLYRSTKAATQWGETVKTAFDLFLPDLARRMGLSLPLIRGQEKEFWRNISIAVDFARDDYLPPRIKDSI